MKTEKILIAVLIVLIFSITAYTKVFSDNNSCCPKHTTTVSGEKTNSSELLNAENKSINPSEVEFKQYSDTKYDFSLSYPDIFTETSKNDNGDGIILKTTDNAYTLKIWGAENTSGKTGRNLLDEAKSRVCCIISENADDSFFNIEYGGGGNGREIIFYETALTSDGKIFSFLFSYPAEEKERFAQLISTMTNNLKKNAIKETNSEKTPYTRLLNALCLSEALHYDGFDIQADRTTINYTVFSLVSKGDFRWKDKLQVIDGSIYFSRGPESEETDTTGQTYIDPELLYKDYFAGGQYQYPHIDMDHLVSGNQMGIAVRMTKLPWDVDVKVNKVSVKNDKTIIEASISRISTTDGKQTPVGDAVITLKKDAKGFFGYKIVSYQPKYPKFADIMVEAPKE